MSVWSRLCPFVKHPETELAAHRDLLDANDTIMYSQVLQGRTEKPVHFAQCAAFHGELREAPHGLAMASWSFPSAKAVELGKVWLKIKRSEGQTAGFGPCFHLPGQPILEFRFFLSHSHSCPGRIRCVKFFDRPSAHH